MLLHMFLDTAGDNTYGPSLILQNGYKIISEKCMYELQSYREIMLFKLGIVYLMHRFIQVMLVLVCSNEWKAESMEPTLVL